MNKNISPPTKNLLVAVLTPRQRRGLNFLLLLWLMAFLIFIIWWLNGDHVINPFFFILNTFILLWFLFLPSYYFFFVRTMKKPNPNLPLPENLKAAMIATRAPSEPFAIVKKTLTAMLAQDFPHDTWLADEDSSPEIKDWCKKHGVFLSSRKGIPGAGDQSLTF